jgi:hypothetical protein
MPLLPASSQTWSISPRQFCAETSSGPVPGHPVYTTLIPVVCDPGHFLAKPTAIERDLSGQDGGLTTIVVISPREL